MNIFPSGSLDVVYSEDDIYGNPFDFVADDTRDLVSDVVDDIPYRLYIDDLDNAYKELNILLDKLNLITFPVVRDDCVTEQGNLFLDLDFTKSFTSKKSFDLNIGDINFMNNILREYGENLKILDISSLEIRDIKEIIKLLKIIIYSLEGIIREKDCKINSREYERRFKIRPKKFYKMKLANDKLKNKDDRKSYKIIQKYFKGVARELIYKLYGIQIDCNLKTYIKLLNYYCDKFAKLY